MSGLEVVGFALVGVALAGVLRFRGVHWPRRHTVEAEAFVVRDAAGRRRAKFGMSEDGGVRLRLFDAEGVCCVSIGVTRTEYARLHLYDTQGVLRAGLGVFPEDGGVGAVFHDQAGKPRLAVSLIDTGAADIRVLDANGAIMWKVP